MYTKALCLVVVAFLAIADGAGIKGRPQQQFQEAATPVRFQSPSKGRLAPAAPARPLPSKASPPAAVPEFTQQQEQQQELPTQQQQQQELDSDPAGAQADLSLARLPAAAAAAPAASEDEEPRGAAEPYAFNYNIDTGDTATSGSSQRDEQMDTTGKVTGFYTLRGDDGRDRRVDYIADASGFRAVVSTNELGTAPKNSADVEWQAQSPSDGQLRAAESATAEARARAAQAAPLKQSKPSSGSWAQQSERFGSASKTSPVAAAAQQQQFQQLQEPFEQIRQTELNARTRKSRHVQFYTI
ncbi:hypothetical protein GZH46_02847 [Fragariocoptes setiger]|uniref:Cuticle protein n=1 Tax=Fragariocoptes setiger TaxID=1670756 RepID=A0ABQ7S5F5_9ACAR|nr:hypothetical protein GZH46_02847 [Fragariocoptes setiger]